MWHYGDEAERRKWQDPEAILTGIGLKSDMVFMDIGCGDGFFTLPAARIVGPGGKVYGLDSNPQGIQAIQERARAEGLHNISLHTARAEDMVLCQGCADRLFFGIVLHDFQDPSQVLQNAHQMLKPEGLLVNLDWKKIDMDFGPPKGKRFAESTASALIESAGFKIESIKESGQYHYIVLAHL